MFSIDDPEISAEELTRRLREEARRRRMQAGTPRNGEPPLDDAPAQSWASAHRAIAAAERYAEVGVRLPTMSTMRGLRRRLAVPIAKLILRAAQLITREQMSFNVETIGALRTLADAVSLDLRTLEHRLATARQEHQRTLANLTTELERHPQALEGRVAAIHEAAAAAEQRVSTMEQALWAWREESMVRFEADARRMAEESARLQRQLLVQERRVGLLAEESRERGEGGAPRNGAATTEELDRLFDAFYASFEDRFRGPRELIKARVSAYLPVVREVGAGTAERPILDLGCGRCEWLELLAEHGLSAKGLDTNLAMVTESRGRGLDVVEAEALTYLRGLPEQSCGAVTAFHIAEHLPFVVVIRLVDEIVRVLQPGGVLILETPNPRNLVVGACNFYIDPTHRSPLHPDTMAFLAEGRGLERVQVRFLHPAEEGRVPEDGSIVASRINECLFGPQDFAVIGYRA